MGEIKNTLHANQDRRPHFESAEGGESSLQAASRDAERQDEVAGACLSLYAVPLGW